MQARACSQYELVPNILRYSFNNLSIFAVIFSFIQDHSAISDEMSAVNLPL